MANGQHKGAEAQMLGQFENAYRTPPGVPAALKIPFTSCGLNRDLRRSNDDSLDNSPLQAKSGCGDAIVAPASIKSVFDARTCGFWLKALFGQPLVKKAVTSQPVNVTGVTIHYAGSAAAAGSGTLAFNQVAGTLTWTAPTGTAGTAVVVSAGGRFTLPGGIANTEIVVDVVAASLPVANQTDTTIGVHATLKAHVFPMTLDDRPSFLLDLGHMKTAQQEFYRYLGGMVQKFGYKLTDREQNADITAFAAEERSADTTPAVTTVWDAAPTGYDRARFCGSSGLMSNGVSGALGVIPEADVEFDNQASGLEVADGLEGYGHTDNGELKIGGSAKIVFRGLQAGNMWTLARSSTTTRVRLQSGVTVGADRFTLSLDCPTVEFMPDAREVSGKTGLFVTCKWMAHRNAAGTLPMLVLVNDVPAY